MDKLDLTFPVFYHGAIKGACSLQQYNCVNMLLRGKIKSDDVTCISDAAASVYVNGAKPLPKDLILALLHLPSNEIMRRLKELNFYDVSAVAAAMLRLLENISISASAKKSLLTILDTPGQEYLFLSELFIRSIKNPVPITRLSKAQKNMINAYRSAMFSHAKRESSDYENTPSENSSQPKDPSVESHYDSENSSNHSESTDFSLLQKHFQEMVHACKWVAKTPSERHMIYNYCIYQFVSKSDLISLDEEDIKNALSDPADDVTIVFLSCEGNLVEVSRYLRDTNHVDGAVSVLFYLETDTDKVSLDDIERLASTVNEKCDKDANFYFTCSLSDDLKSGTIRVYVIARFSATKSTVDNGATKPDNNSFDHAEAPEDIDENDQFPLNLFQK